MRHGRKLGLWPDCMSRETLAARLDVEPSYIDQLVKRRLLPSPLHLGEAKRWRWADVDKYVGALEAGHESHADREDPYLAGIESGATEETSH